MIKKIAFMSFLLIAPFARMHATEEVQETCSACVEVACAEQATETCSSCVDTVVAPASALTFKAVFQEEGVEAQCCESVLPADGAFSCTFGAFGFAGTVVRSETVENAAVVSYTLAFEPTGQVERGCDTVTFGAENVVTITQQSNSTDAEGNEVITSKVIATLGFVVNQE